MLSNSSNVLSRFSGRSWHSQTTITFQPASSSCFFFRASRSILVFILLCQNSALFLGQTKYLHPSCPCQKHPFTNITVLYFGNTTSGLPGSFCHFFGNGIPLKINISLQSLPASCPCHVCRTYYSSGQPYYEHPSSLSISLSIWRICQKTPSSNFTGMLFPAIRIILSLENNWSPLWNATLLFFNFQ